VTGCASLGARNAVDRPFRDTAPQRYIYPGMPISFEIMAEGACVAIGPRDPYVPVPRLLGLYAFAVALVDLPFSVVVDTVCLPYDVWMVTGGGKTRGGLRRSELAFVRNHRGETQLILAAKEGDIRRVELLMEMGADINAADDNGQSALMWAAAHRFLDRSEMVTLLIRLGADVHLRDKSGQTARGLALRNGNQRIADLLVELGAPILPEDESMEAAMQEALVTRNVEIAAYLIKRNRNIIDVQNADGQTALMNAASDGDVVWTETLLGFGADVNRTDHDGRTPLMYAVESGNADVVERLVQQGVDWNRTDRDGRTPLMYAVESGNADVVERLIKQDVDLNRTDRDGRTPLIYAAESGNADTVERLVSRIANRVLIL
jgi:ankyrin repeat protein